MLDEALSNIGLSFLVIHSVRAKAIDFNEIVDKFGVTYPHCRVQLTAVKQQLDYKAIVQFVPVCISVYSIVTDSPFEVGLHATDCRPIVYYSPLQSTDCTKHFYSSFFVSLY